jgi:hypothetical protein
MTARELIEQLQEWPPDAVVFTHEGKRTGLGGTDASFFANPPFDKEKEAFHGWIDIEDPYS